jgi:hypothetical protein
MVRNDQSGNTLINYGNTPIYRIFLGTYTPWAITYIQNHVSIASFDDQIMLFYPFPSYPSQGIFLQQSDKSPVIEPHTWLGITFLI